MDDHSKHKGMEKRANEATRGGADVLFSHLATFSVSLEFNHGDPELPREPASWYPVHWEEIPNAHLGTLMNADLRRRSDEVISRLTQLRDSL
jgi:hypothetical protein